MFRFSIHCRRTVHHAGEEVGSTGASLGTKSRSYPRADTATRIGQTVATGVTIRLQEVAKVLAECCSTFATGDVEAVARSTLPSLCGHPVQPLKSRTAGHPGIRFNQRIEYFAKPAGLEAQRLRGRRAGEIVETRAQAPR